ncbi:MAG: beta-N-acetylglucosaminidase [Chitinophagales bacterium]|nr:MAG: beta-N-acetylglucosaminidase [Chitinophagales bacterium]
MWCAAFSAFSQDIIQMSMERMKYVKAREHWVDSVFNQLNDRQRIAQLFMAAAYSNRDDAHVNEIIRLISEYEIGGLIFFQGTPYRQAQLTNDYQAISRVPLLIAMDAEWGLGMRLDSTLSFPRQLTLGAIADVRLIEEMGKEIARQCRRMGIHINFAPVADINSNPNNPVIHDRSFGEDKLNVSLKALAYMEGLQSNGVMACAKHFPGHGDTDSDSHLTLPVIRHDKSRLDNLELYPFKVLINNGVQSVMVAHVHIPALDSTPNLAASLSPRITTTLLKTELGFTGLVFSDALNMKGVSNYYKPGEVDLMAFLAGSDVMLFSEDIPRALTLFTEALEKGTIHREDLYSRVKKILNAKYDAGLHHLKPIALQGLSADLNTPAAQWLRQRLYEEALTLVANEGQLIPFQRLEDKSFAAVAVGVTGQTPFQEMLSKYTPVDLYQVKKDDAAALNQLKTKLATYDVVFISFHDMSRQPGRNFGLTDASLQFARELSRKTRVVAVIFGSPYSLKFFHDFKWVLQAYEEQPAAQRVAAQLLFGGIAARGKLPVTASEKYPLGTGLSTPLPSRLKYTYPEEVGIASAYLSAVDEIARDAIRDKATPGCQILIAKDGKVIYEKSFGYYTYDSLTPVQNTSIYDLASLTKILATTLALMKLMDERKFQLNRTFADYLPETEKSLLKDVVMKDVLLHQAGFKSWIPFYEATLADSIYKTLYRPVREEPYTIEVAESLFLRKDYADSIYKQILTAPLNPKKEYLYSDLGFYLLKLVIERLSGEPLDAYVSRTFYSPLGLSTMTFRPLQKFEVSRIIPTEQDRVFRKQLLQGYVHDPGAAMLGGVSGHAGLFSSAHDIAVLMQMLLNKGEYGGERYLNPTTVALFTRRQEEKNRRGLGFDKPEIDIYKPKPTAEDASPRTFGHSGFTGTCVWVDPDYNLIYIFLSNRVHPGADNNKLIKNNIRTRIHQAIYDAIKKSNNGILTQSN